MRHPSIRLVMSALLLASGATASAQTTTAAPAAKSGGLGGLGGLGSLLGGGLPSVAQTGAGNATGVLGYCVKNKLVNETSAQSILGKLTGQKAVTDSPAFTAGQSGQLQTGSGILPLANLKGQVKTKVCDLVLKRAGSFL